MGGEGILETKGVPLYPDSEKRGLGKGARISYTCRVRYTVYIRILYMYSTLYGYCMYRYSNVGIYIDIARKGYR